MRSIRAKTILLIMVAVIYFVMTFVLTKLLAVFERRMRRGDIR